VSDNFLHLTFWRHGLHVGKGFVGLLSGLRTSQYNELTLDQDLNFSELVQNMCIYRAAKSEGSLNNNESTYVSTFKVIDPKVIQV